MMRSAVLALVLVLVPATTSPALAAAPRPVPINDVAALAASCPENLYFLVRGDGEAPQGPDSANRSSYAQAPFRGAGDIVSRTVWTKDAGVVPVAYPALPASTLASSPKKWARSIAAGAKDLQAQLNRANEVPCLRPSAKFLVGYSSGAAVIRGAVNGLAPAIQDQITGIVVFGDPTADSREKVGQGIKYKVKNHRVGLAHARTVAKRLPRATLKRYPSAMRSRVLSFCHGYDVVCRLSEKPSRESSRDLAKIWSRGAGDHARYLKGLTRDASSWIYQRRARISPQIDWDERSLTVGVQSELTFTGKGAFPPFAVQLDGTALTGTGLSVNGGSIVGTPMKELYQKVDYSVTDAVGRTSTGSVYLRATYTAPSVQVIDSGAGQDKSGNNIGSPSVSSDGRFVAFGSSADNRYGPDANALPDVYLRDTQAQTTIRLSKTGSGVETNGESTDPEISADGRVVAFTTRANNLTANGDYGVHVYDRTSGSLTWLGPGYEPEVSSDGSVVAYRSNGNLVVHDMRSGQRVVAGSDYKLREFDLSGDGRWLLLSMFSDAGGLVVRMRIDGSERSQVSTVANADAASISADGRFVSYSGTVDPPFYGDLYLTDTLTQTTTMIRESVLVESTSLSADGRVLVYEMVSCRGEAAAVAYYDRATGGTRGIWDSRSGADGFISGYAATPQVSADGLSVAFTNIPANGPIDVLLAHVG